MGHGVDVTRRNYLHVVRAYKRRGRVPVERQIADARTALGVGVAASALHERQRPASSSKQKLSSLQVVRAQRRAV